MEFYDAATWQNMPADSHAMLYADGLFRAPPSAMKRFAATRWITVLGGESAGLYAGAADYELGNPVYGNPGALREWAAKRHAMNCRARAYFNRSDAAKAWDQLHDLPNVFAWVATLDDREWTADGLAANLASEWGAPIPAERLWANQFAGGITAGYDTSRLYAEW
jgi:hypothetical protein